RVQVQPAQRLYAPDNRTVAGVSQQEMGRAGVVGAARQVGQQRADQPRQVQAQVVDVLDLGGGAPSRLFGRGRLVPDVATRGLAVQVQGVGPGVFALDQPAQLGHVHIGNRHEFLVRAQ